MKIKSVKIDTFLLINFLNFLNFLIFLIFLISLKYMENKIQDSNNSRYKLFWTVVQFYKNLQIKLILCWKFSKDEKSYSKRKEKIIVSNTIDSSSSGAIMHDDNFRFGDVSRLL